MLLFACLSVLACDVSRYIVLLQFWVNPAFRAEAGASMDYNVCWYPAVVIQKSYPNGSVYVWNERCGHCTGCLWFIVFRATSTRLRRIGLLFSKGAKVNVVGRVHACCVCTKSAGLLFSCS